MRNIQIPHGANSIIQDLRKAGFDAYVVGGCVRDSLLDLEPKDWDICTSATPVEMKAFFSERNTKTIDTGLQHGTITVNLGDSEQYEVTTFRIDGNYSDSRHPDSVEFVKNIELDLARRDFTVNAMAYDGERIIDPFHGQDDLNRRIISCVGNPDDRFGEDALRILRAMRFASTYGFAIEEKTSQAIHRNKEKLLNISAERIQAELCKMLCGRGVLQILLEYSDVIAVIIPEMSPCIGFDQNNKYHEYTIYDHICHAVENCGLNDIVIKFSLFLHDIGKPCCYTTDENGGHFYGHGVYSRDLAEKVLDRLRFDNKTKRDILELVLFHDAVIEPTPKTVRRWLNKIGELQFSRLVEVRMADILAHKEGTQHSRLERCVSLAAIAYEIVEQNQCFSLKDLEISGKDVMELLNIEEGKRVGFVLNKVLDAVMDGSLKNERAHIVNYLNENKEVLSCEFSC